MSSGTYIRNLEPTHVICHLVLHMSCMTLMLNLHSALCLSEKPLGCSVYQTVFGEYGCATDTFMVCPGAPYTGSCGP